MTWRAVLERDVLTPAAALPGAEECRRRAQDRGPDGTIELGLELSAEGVR